LRGLGVDFGIVLKTALEKYSAIKWAGLNWLRVETIVGLGSSEHTMNRWVP
jgi:hypothetical protein